MIVCMCVELIHKMLIHDKMSSSSQTHFLLCQLTQTHTHKYVIHLTTHADVLLNIGILSPPFSFLYPTHLTTKQLLHTYIPTLVQILVHSMHSHPCTSIYTTCHLLCWSLLISLPLSPSLSSTHHLFHPCPISLFLSLISFILSPSPSSFPHLSLPLTISLLSFPISLFLSPSHSSSLLSLPFPISLFLSPSLSSFPHLSPPLPISFHLSLHPPKSTGPLLSSQPH